MWISACHVPILFPLGLPVLLEPGNKELHFSDPLVDQVWDVIGQSQIQLLGIGQMGWDRDHPVLSLQQSTAVVVLGGSVVASAEGPGSSILGIQRHGAPACCWWRVSIRQGWLCGWQLRQQLPRARCSLVPFSWSIRSGRCVCDSSFSQWGPRQWLCEGWARYTVLLVFWEPRFGFLPLLDHPTIK